MTTRDGRGSFIVGSGPISTARGNDYCSAQTSGPRGSAVCPGHTFVPRGNNYIRLAWVGDELYHSTFDPNAYDAAAAEAALAAMEADGYNVVRVFIDPGNWSRASGINGPPDTPGLDGAYLDAVSDFVVRATRHHIYVLPTLGLFPFNDHYLGMSLPWDPNIEGWNAYTMHSGHLRAKEAYVQDFIRGLAQRVGKPLLSTIFAYSLENEQFHDGSVLPFSSTTLTLTTANGMTYSMASAASRQQAADANAGFFANTLVRAVHAIDSSALVTMGVFTYNAVGRAGPSGLLPIPRPEQDPRFPVRPLMLSRYSQLSFLDVHVYPSPSTPLATDLGSSEWAGLNPAVPVVMGEFGAFKFLYPDLTTAAFAVRDQQVESCSFRFSGWLFWTYDSIEQPELWTLLDRAGAINGVLAPLARPSPCSP